MSDEVQRHVEFLERTKTVDIGLEKERVDLAWCSDLCKKKILDIIIDKYPCPQRFSKTEVIPLFPDDPFRYYRVKLWVRDWSSDACVYELWKTFYVTLRGIERTIVSIEESKSPKLPLSQNGRKFREELGE